MAARKHQGEWVKNEKRCFQKPPSYMYAVCAPRGRGNNGTSSFTRRGKRRLRSVEDVHLLPPSRLFLIYLGCRRVAVFQESFTALNERVQHDLRDMEREFQLEKERKQLHVMRGLLRKAFPETEVSLERIIDHARLNFPRT